MKKLNKQPILSNNPILNKYLITYTKPDIWIDEIDDYFINWIANTEDEKFINYILTEYYNEEEMINYPYYYIRCLYAERKKYLDILYKDPNSIVRLEVARQGYYHDILYKDDSALVRAEVAKQGNYHEELHKDPSWFVRREIAKHGKYLDIYKDDDNESVREEVVYHGKYLNILKNDKHQYIRYIAHEKLKEQKNEENKQ